MRSIAHFIPSRLFYYVLAIMAFFCTISVAAAQGLAADPASGFDIGAIFGSAAALAGFVVGLVQFVRAHVWTTLDGAMSIAFTFVAAIVLAIIGFYMHLLNALTLAEAAGFGASAGVLAIGGVNLLKSMANKTPPVKPA